MGVSIEDKMLDSDFVGDVLRIATPGTNRIRFQSPRLATVSWPGRTGARQREEPAAAVE